jgi:AraC-like DNA-binding protein
MASATVVLWWMTTSHIVACLVLLWRDGRGERYTPYLTAFLAAVVCYLHTHSALAGPPPYSAWVHLLVAARGALPFAFWAVTRSVFEDGFRLRPVHALPAVGQVALHHAAILAAKGYFGPGLGVVGVQAVVLLAVASGCAFALAAILGVLREAPDDLVEARQRMRVNYVRLAGGYIVLAVLAAWMPVVGRPVPFWRFLDALATYGLILAFSLTQMRLDLGRAPARPPVEASDGLEQQLTDLMEREQFYKTSGLTIGRLAEQLGQPEHKVRALINGRLGFRNFSAFLNGYRLREAARVLSDRTQDDLTVAEIAFALGYQSLGPFNRAFKEAKGQTPSEFRKASPR